MKKIQHTIIKDGWTSGNEEDYQKTKNKYAVRKRQRQNECCDFAHVPMNVTDYSQCNQTQ